jgi:hypothetical protein
MMLIDMMMFLFANLDILIVAFFLLDIMSMDNVDAIGIIFSGLVILWLQAYFAE